MASVGGGGAARNMFGHNHNETSCHGLSFDPEGCAFSAIPADGVGGIAPHASTAASSSSSSSSSAPSRQLPVSGFIMPTTTIGDSNYSLVLKIQAAWRVRVTDLGYVPIDPMVRLGGGKEVRASTRLFDGGGWQPSEPSRLTEDAEARLHLGWGARIRPYDNATKCLQVLVGLARAHVAGAPFPKLNTLLHGGGLKHVYSWLKNGFASQNGRISLAHPSDRDILNSALIDLGSTWHCQLDRRMISTSTIRTGQERAEAAAITLGIRTNKKIVELEAWAKIKNAEDSEWRVTKTPPIIATPTITDLYAFLITRVPTAAHRCRVSRDDAAALNRCLFRKINGDLYFFIEQDAYVQPGNRAKV